MTFIHDSKFSYLVTSFRSPLTSSAMTLYYIHCSYLSSVIQYAEMLVFNSFIIYPHSFQQV